MKIFVIEDEPPILREIVSIIESFHEDYQIIGKAQNGQEAMNFLKIHGQQIDVMITDIQIPVINGLDLISYTHEHLPHILSIILTGFSNFNYAQKAIRYGVFDYLLKPIDEDELHRQLQKAYAQKCLDYIHQRPEKPSPVSQPVESRYQIALITLGSFPMYASQYNELFPEMWKQLDVPILFESHPELKDHYWIIDGLTLAEKIVLFLPPEGSLGSDGSVLSSLLEPLLDKAFSVTIAIDTRFFGIRNIHQSILNIRSFLNKQVRLEKSQLLFYTEEEDAPVDYQIFHAYCARLSNLFVQKNIPVFEAELKNFLKAMRSQSLPTVSVYRLLQDLLHACIQAADETFSPNLPDVQTTVGDILMLSDNYRTLYENIQSIFLSLFENMLKEENVLNDKSNTLMKVDSYMKENYTKPINTKSVAEQFSFTPAYLSKIFREYKHITPADYIIWLRIEKAKELFATNPSCKIKDVAAFVGYEDSLYFSKVFKKSTGLSPKQFLETLDK